MSHLRHWGLERSAFESELDPEFFYPSEGHAEALARLEFLARQPGCQLGVLTGEIGCGKSFTRAVFASRSRTSRLVAQLSTSHYPYPDLLREILLQLGQADPGSAVSEYDLMQLLRRVLASADRPAVLLLDEAQELDRRSLVGVRALNNLADGALDLTVVLVGQPELRGLVRELPQLDQRTGLRYHLAPLPSESVPGYLRFRLCTAGHPDGELFAPAAAAAIAEASRGVPREVNRVARLAMAAAAGHGAPRVTADDVQRVAADLERQRGPVVA